MIDRTHRFHGQGSLRFVQSSGQKIRGSAVSLRYAHNNRQITYRAAIVVSRKVSKSAVVRNRVRRRLYEIIRKISGRIVGPYDLIFTVHGQEVADMPHSGLERLIAAQLTQAGVLGAKDGPTPEPGVV